MTMVMPSRRARIAKIEFFVMVAEFRVVVGQKQNHEANRLGESPISRSQRAAIARSTRLRMPSVERAVERERLACAWNVEQ